MNLKKIGWDDVDWIDMVQGPVEGSCIYGIGLSGFIKCWEFLECLHN
jgi:hypothetical protein